MVIDGGKGQLASAIKGMTKAGVRPIGVPAEAGDPIPQFKEHATVAVCALAKNEEQVFIYGQNTPVNNTPDSPALLLLRALRDESHRFALSAHRNRRSIRKST